MFGLRKKKLKLTVTEDKCNACGRCLMQCRYNVIGLGYQDYTICAKLMHADRCTACGKCVKVCRQGALELKEVAKQNKVNEQIIEEQIIEEQIIKCGNFPCHI